MGHDATDPRYRGLVDALDEGFAFLDRDARVVFANPAASRILGLTNEQLIGHAGYDPAWNASFEDGPATPDDYPGIVALRTGQPVSNVVMCVAHVDGREAWVTLNARPVFEDGDSTPSGVVVSFTDITQQRRMASALREHVELFRRIFDATTDAITLFDLDTLRFLEVNDATSRIYGYSREDLLTMTILEVSAEPITAARRLAGRDEPGWSANVPLAWHRRRDGTVFPVDIAGGSIDVDDRRVGFRVIRDVSERFRAADDLREERDHGRALVDALQDGLVETGIDGRITNVTERFCEMTGFARDDLIGQAAPYPFWPTELRGEYRDALRSSGSMPEGSWDLEFSRADGTMFPVLVTASTVRDADGEPRGLLGVVRDLTERRALRIAEVERELRDAEIERHRLEVELTKAQRLDSLGRLAGGIAHDFNNLLGVILNYAGFVSKRLDPSSGLVEDVAEIRRAAEQASHLTRQLLLFGRREETRPELFDLRPAVEDAVSLLRRELEGIGTQLVLPDDAIVVQADRDQFGQVLMNLLLNARDAGAGAIHLTMRADENTVRLTVGDDGEGMPRQVIDRAFEPFFTTRSRDGGSGLGLASVHGIVTGAGGTIALESAPGAGTVVSISLPRVTGPNGFGESDQSPFDADCPTILVVDDEPKVRSIMSRILREGGYRVIEARSGPDALERARGDATDAALLLTDVVMPGMSGPQLADELLLSRPDMAVLFTSGYAHGELGDRATSAALLAKPFTEEDLLDAVARAVGGAPV